MAKTSSMRDPNPQFAVILGTAVFIVCGIFVSVLASTSLSADDYVNFMAFVSLSGIVVLGLGSALEQESTLVHFRANGAIGEAWRFMLWRVGLSTIGIWVVFLVPIFSWQERLFGSNARQIQIAVLLGAPGLLMTNVARGFTNGQGKFLQLGKAHILFGLSTVLVPLTLYASGTPLFQSLIFGQIIAWSSPLLVLLRNNSDASAPTAMSLNKAPNITLWLMASNFFLLANLNSTNLILRKSTGVISSSMIAEAQLLVTMSCLASALTLGLFPFLIAKFKRVSTTTERGWEKHLTKILICLAFLVVLGTTLFRQLIVAILLPRESRISLLDCILLTLPAFFWTCSLIMSARIIAQERVRRNLLCWLFGLAALWILTSISNSQEIRPLIFALFIGSLMSPIVFAFSRFRVRADQNLPNLI